MNQIKIRDKKITIKYPILHKKFNALYSLEKNEIYYACSKNCKICKEWKKQIWKTDIFFPYHCHLCESAGYSEDFKRINIFFVCSNCSKDIQKRKKDLFLRKK